MTEVKNNTWNTKGKYQYVNMKNTRNGRCVLCGTELCNRATFESTYKVLTMLENLIATLVFSHIMSLES